MASLSGAPSREILMRAIDGVPWDHLAHAYAAARDAPVQLRRFVWVVQVRGGLAVGLDPAPR